MILVDRGNRTLSVGEIQFSGFDVSWAGDSLDPGTICVGSEDGRIRITGERGESIGGPFRVSPSGEAVNGVAFSDGLMAVSTRQDVSFHSFPSASGGPDGGAVHPFGAHGVGTSPAGGFVAPLGHRGVLSVEGREGAEQTARVYRAASDRPLYFYRTAILSDPAHGSILVVAGRTGGLESMPWPASPPPNGNGKRHTPLGVDFVDVAPLGAAEAPYAAAGLGLDGSIHLVGDFLNGRSSITVHFERPGERVYRLLALNGHMFLLTDRGLYAFRRLGANFLEGRLKGSLLKLDVVGLPIEALDVSIVAGRSLLVVSAIPGTLYRIEIDQLLGGDLPGTTSENGATYSDVPTNAIDLKPGGGLGRAFEVQLVPAIR